MNKAIEGIRARDEAMLRAWRLETAKQLGHVVTDDAHWLDRPDDGQSGPAAEVGFDETGQESRPPKR